MALMTTYSHCLSVLQYWLDIFMISPSTTVAEPLSKRKHLFFFTATHLILSLTGYHGFRLCASPPTKVQFLCESYPTFESPDATTADVNDTLSGSAVRERKTPCGTFRCLPSDFPSFPYCYRYK